MKSHYVEDLDVRRYQQFVAVFERLPGHPLVADLE
jgi:hypothetical protein